RPAGRAAVCMNARKNVYSQCLILKTIQTWKNVLIQSNKQGQARLNPVVAKKRAVKRNVKAW
ncbi:MAG: hypothetical protein K2L03_02065, partial [Bacteroidales bacterium]|nr:hypothetical protein [Bacteroidales bacterium]